MSNIMMRFRKAILYLVLLFPPAASAPHLALGGMFCLLLRALLPCDICLGGTGTLPESLSLHNIDPLRKADKDSRRAYVMAD